MGLRAHWLQHVPFEGLGSIEAWLLKNRATVSVTRFFERAALPGLDEFDLLVIMGGPMSVNDERAHSWLKEEKAFAAKAIDAGKAVLGVCLGAQLIASALGARVRRNAFPEIGWFPLESMTDSAAQGILGALPGRFEAFHWHGETFDLPDKATQVARSEACENQGFALGDRVLALQFHLETTPASARALVENCRSDLLPSRFVQVESLVLGRPEQFRRINATMATVLDRLTAAP